MTVYVHRSGERVRPKPGGAEEARLVESDDWKPETDKQYEERTGKRIAYAHGTARVNLTGKGGEGK